MKTLMILGAGASKSYGYPLGNELKDRLLLQLKRPSPTSRNPLFDLLVEAGNSEGEIDTFTRYLEEGLYETIDEFLANRWNESFVRQIGLRALAYEISGWENETTLFQVDSLHWYRALVDFLHRNPGLANSGNFSFLTFNYDRSLDHCLHQALIARNRITREVIEENFLSLGNLVHLHGITGFLPWQRPSSRDGVRRYGEAITAQKVAYFANGLLLPHQELTVGSDIKEMLMSADVIAIIGFGFHRANLQRIFFDELCSRPGVKIFATVVNPDEDVFAALNNRSSVRGFTAPAHEFMPEFLRRLERGGLDDWGHGPGVIGGI
jgi:hypothetical protein